MSKRSAELVSLFGGVELPYKDHSLPVQQAISQYLSVDGEAWKYLGYLEEIGLGILPGYRLTLEDVMAHAGYNSLHNPMPRRRWNTKLAEMRHEQARKLTRPVCVVSYKDGVYVGDNEIHAVSQVMDKLDAFPYPGDPGRKNPAQRIVWWNGLEGNETHQIRVFTNVPVNR